MLFKSFLSDSVPGTFEEPIAQKLTVGNTFCKLYAIDVLNLILIDELLGMCGVPRSSHPLATMLGCGELHRAHPFSHGRTPWVHSKLCDDSCVVTPASLPLF